MRPRRQTQEEADDSESTMFKVTVDPISDPLLASPAAGALASFEGRVRNHHDGRAVSDLEYEAYAEMAEKEGEAVMREALERFTVLEARCTHRVGPLKIGDVAVRVDVLAAHRGDALAACAWIIDAVKERVPIWKKERYETGEHAWVNANPE